jgi:hypothetical protein
MVESDQVRRERGEGGKEREKRDEAEEEGVVILVAGIEACGRRNTVFLCI